MMEGPRHQHLHQERQEPLEEPLEKGSEFVRFSQITRYLKDKKHISRIATNHTTSARVLCVRLSKSHGNSVYIHIQSDACSCKDATMLEKSAGTMLEKECTGSFFAAFTGALIALPGS